MNLPVKKKPVKASGAANQAPVFGKLVCLNGKNKGLTYVIQEKRVIMGRGKTCQVQVYDANSSREHAEIVKIDDDFILTDLRSQNGVIVNDLKITQYKLKDNDRILIGKTVYLFKKQRLSQSDIHKIEALKYSDGSIDFKEEKPKSKPQNEEKKKSKVGIYAVIILAVVMFLFDGEETTTNNEAERQVQKDDKSDITEDVSDRLRRIRESEDKEIGKKLKVIFQRGLREFRENNYFRAINEFNLALILSPGHPKAEYYKSRAKQALDEEVKVLFINGKRDRDALRYDKSTKSYCAIMRLLQNYPDDDRYKNASESLLEVEKKMGLEEGEIKCFEVE